MGPSSCTRKSLTCAAIGENVAQMDLKSNHIWFMEMCLIGYFIVQLGMPGGAERLAPKS